MKPTAVILSATILLQILAPGFCFASGRLGDERSGGVMGRATSSSSSAGNADRTESEDESAAAIVERAIRCSMRPIVRVITRDALDLSQITMGSHVGVLYTAKGAKKIAIGRVLSTSADHIVVSSKSYFDNKRSIGRYQIDVLAIADDLAKIELWRLATQAIQKPREEQPPKLRLKAPSISRQWITGSLVGSTPEMLELQCLDGIRRIPPSSIDELAVSAGSYRRTALGMKIGLVLAVLVPVAVPAIAGAHFGGIGALQTQAEVLTLTYFAKVALPIFLGSTLMGASIKSERWIEFTPRCLNLTVAPTQSRGFGAAVSFNF